MDILKINLYNKFYHDYVNNLEVTHPFISSLTKRPITDIIPKFKSDPNHFQEIKTILAEQNKDQNSEQSALYLQYLEDPDSLILITGQQLGLFASPLYTIYKLITTIKLAESLNSKNGNHKYIPVFWLETEDHDFQEINHIGIYDKNFKPEQLLYEGMDREKVSIRYYQFENCIENFIDKLKNSLIETEFSDGLFEKLREYFKPGVGWSTAVRNFLKDLFAPYGLLFFEPGDNKIKQKSIPFFKQLLEENEQVSAIFSETSEQLIASGYYSQVKVLSGQTYIHFENEARQRMHLFREDNSYSMKDGSNNLTLNEALKYVENKPLSISSTVISRPLLQSWLLPVAAYVAGPGEIAYWAQLGQLFGHFELDMPFLYPRISATIVEPKIKRYISKYAIASDKLVPRKKDFIDQYYKDLAEAEEDPLENLQQILKDGEGNITSYLNSIDPTLIETGKKTIERMAQTLMNFENSVLKARKDKESLRTNHLEQIHTAFFPEEAPQERYLTLVYFINKFGPEIINHLYKNLSLDNFDHQITYL